MYSYAGSMQFYAGTRFHLSLGGSEGAGRPISREQKGKWIHFPLSREIWRLLALTGRSVGRLQTARVITPGQWRHVYKDLAYQLR